MKTVIFTGAGAGKTDGLPLQTELFQTFFAQSIPNDQRRALAERVRQFFVSVFGVDPRETPTPSLPTFEEALGVLELAIARDEGLGGMGEGSRLAGDLRPIRRDLILALAATVGRDDAPTSTNHSRLVANLRQSGTLEETTFVTTNYDTLIDDAIEAEAIVGGRGTGSIVDYGLGDLSPETRDTHAETRSFACLKIHGSLNWLQCPVCDVLDITFASNGATRLIDDPEGAQCLVCESLRTPVIVPPSYYKDLSSVHLAVVWNKTSRALQAADHVVFCGYSFPDADIHIKYLLKRAELNRDPDLRPLRVSLANDHPGKPGNAKAMEYERFSRFLGGIEVIDMNLSFEQFAEDVARLLD